MKRVTKGGDIYSDTETLRAFWQLRALFFPFGHNNLLTISARLARQLYAKKSEPLAFWGKCIKSSTFHMSR